MKTIFVCQAGELEVKAALLAASLRKQLGDSKRIICIFPAPVSDFGSPSKLVRDTLDSLGVEIISTAQPFGCRYAIANKIAALRAAGNEPALLLDSDVLCLCPPPFSSLSDEVSVAAKPADVLVVRRSDREWASIYSQCDLPVPTYRVRTTVSREISFPYYNAGVVYARDAEKLGSYWMQYCEAVDSLTEIGHKYPWLDQIALPLAIRALGWQALSLSENWNYPAHLRTPLNGEIVPFFVHYHTPATLSASSDLQKYVRGLMERYPLVQALMNEASCWRGF